MSGVTKNAGRCACALVLSTLAGRAGAQAFHELVGYPTNEVAHEAKRTSDGGYVSVGSIGTAATARSDFHVVRYDPMGMPIWDVRYGTTAGNDEAYSVEQTTDGGFLVVGFTDVFGGLQNIAALRLDAAGALVWAFAYEGDSWFEDIVGAENGTQNVNLLPDGSALIVGRKIIGNVQGGQALRIDGAGGVIYNRAFFAANGRSTTFAQSHGLGGTLGIAITGSIDVTAAGGPRDLDVLGIRMTGAGVIAAASRYATIDPLGGGVVSQQANGLDTAGTASDIAITSRINVPGAAGRPTAVEFLRLDSALNVLSARQYILPLPWYPGSAAIKENRRDGNILLGGTRSVAVGTEASWLHLVDPNGDTVWCTLFGQQVFPSIGHSVISPRDATTRNEYLLAGTATSALFGFGGTDIYFLRTGEYGQTGCFEECSRPDVLTPSVNRTAVTFTAQNLNAVDVWPGQLVRGMPPAKVLCSGKLCAADLNGDGVLDLGDFFDFFNFFDATDPRADINNDCVVDLADFFLFLGLFDTSCA